VIASAGEIGAGLLFIVENTNNLKITTRFRGYDISKIHVGMEVSIRSDATIDDVFVGIVHKIHPAVSRDLTLVAEIEVEIHLTSANTGLMIGTNVDVIID
jgi:multidrug resistance efflux pump